MEVESYVKQIEIADRKGKEYIMIIDTDIKNGDTFITDSNGLQF